MDTRPDILVQNRDGRTIAIVEIKRGSTISTDTAAVIKQWRLEDGNLRGVRFFLLVTQKGIYLWDLEGKVHAHGLTNRESILSRFLQERMTEPLDEHVMLLATYEWLVHLTYHEPDSSDQAERTLQESGFLALLKDAQFRFESAA